METKLSVIVPAYNEEGAVADTVAQLRQALDSVGCQHEILVVNDGSTDATANKAKTAGAIVISHPKNAGYGGALRTGIENAKYDLVATIDCDLSYPPSELLKLLPLADKFDMVVGARGGRHYWGNLFKHPARILFLALAQFVVGEKIPDVNSGLRILRKKPVLEMLPRLCRGFSFSTTLTLSFMSSHLFVQFVPIEYAARVGSSKVRYVRDTLRTLQLILETIIYYNPIKAGLILAFPTTIGAVVALLAYLSTGAMLWILMCTLLLCWSLMFTGLGFLMLAISQTKYSK
ncbi:MAG: glycosyltransferase family 2 protein [Elusimicrobiota bacterium]